MKMKIKFKFQDIMVIIKFENIKHANVFLFYND